MSLSNTNIPKITSFSPDSGTSGDDVTDATILTLDGTAAADTTVQVYDGATLLGVAAVNASGAWTFTTPTLATGVNTFVATDTNAAGDVGEASAALAVTVEAAAATQQVAAVTTQGSAAAPAAPTISGVTGYGAVANGGMNADNVLTLNGAAQANSTITVYDGSASLGTALVDSAGAWSFTTGQLGESTQNFTAVDTSSAGGVSPASSAYAVTVETLSPGGPASLGVNMDGADYSWGGYPTLADLQNLRSEGITLVRLPIAWEMMQPTLDGALNQTYLSGLKTFLGQAASLGMSVVVDLHNYGGYDLNWAADAAANYGIEATDGADASKIGTAAVPDSAFANFWQQLATALAGNAGVAGYDIMNEPDNMPNAAAWPAAAQAAVTAIRTVDMKTPILVEGDEWASAQYWQSYNGSLNITDPAKDIIYEGHQYFDNGSGTYTETYAQTGDNANSGITDIASYTQWLTQTGNRGFLGELGVPSNNNAQWIPLLNNVLTYLQQSDISATVWNYEMPDSQPAWWVTQIEDTANPGVLNIAPFAGTITPQMAALFEHSQPVVESSIVGTAAGTLVLGGVAAGSSLVTVFNKGVSIGTTTAAVNGAWSFTTAALAAGSQSFTASCADSSGDVSELSAALAVTTTGAGSGGGSGPAAPSITSFSPDTGVVGDGVTSATQLTLTGTATASTSVDIYDGATELGVATVNSSGAWSFGTATLASGAHSFTAVDVSGGVSSAASSVLSVTVDTTPPPAPVISTDAATGVDQFILTGTAQASTTITVYDSGSQIGTASANASGAWTFTTPSLTGTTQVFTATATDAAGNVSALSAALDPVLGGGSAPAAPIFTSFSPDTGVVGDGVTSATTLTLNGTATASTSMDLYDGTNEIGVVGVNSSGDWSWTGTFAAGVQNFSAVDISGGVDSAKSAVLSVTIETTPPPAPVISTDAATGVNAFILTGTAQASTTIKVYDSGSLLGSATANASGAWSFTTSSLTGTTQVFTATATNAAGLTSVASAALDATLSSGGGGSGTDTAAQAASVTSGSVEVSDTAADISSALTALNGNAHVSEIVISNNAALTLSASQAANETTALGKVSDANGAAYKIAVTDTGANIGSYLNPMEANGHVAAITDSNNAWIAVSVGELTNDGTLLGELKNASGAKMDLGLTDTAANIETLTGGPINTFKADGGQSITSTNASVALNAAGASAIEAAGITIAAPSGDMVSIYDTQTNITSHQSALTALADTGQIAYIRGVTSGGPTTTQFFTSDSLAYTEVAAADGAYSFTAAKSGVAISATSSGNDTFAGASAGGDTFVFSSNFANDVVTNFMATGTNHDVLQLNAASFSYLTAGESQAADLAAVVAHGVTSTGAGSMITDSAGAKVTLDGISLSASTLSSQAAAFKFV